MNKEMICHFSMLHYMEIGYSPLSTLLANNATCPLGQIDNLLNGLNKSQI